MPQFFIDDRDIDGDKTVLRGDDCHHLINVRRVKTGDLIRLRSDSGKGYMARVLEVKRSEIQLTILEETAPGNDSVSISLYMALLKSGNFEFVLQKAVEIGVNRIVPVTSSRTVPDPGKKIDSKHERWSKIISGASKQSFRSSMPVLELPLTFSEAVKNDDADLKLIAHPGAVTELRDYLSSCGRPDTVSLLVGPEGGFTGDELNSAAEKGWVPVNFGATHLRAETAAVILPSLVLYHWS